MPPHRAILAVTLLVGVVMFITTPVLIAMIRRHPARGTIARLTPFAALSLILWAALLAWAASNRRDDGVINRAVARLRERRLLPIVVGAVVVGSVIVAAIGLRH